MCARVMIYRHCLLLQSCVLLRVYFRTLPQQMSHFWKRKKKKLNKKNINGLIIWLEKKFPRELSFQPDINHS